MGFAFSEDSNQLFTEINQLGYHLGMSFQYVDDLLDIQSDAKTLGKPTGADINSDKLTSIKVFGINGTQKKSPSTPNKSKAYSIK